MRASLLVLSLGVGLSGCYRTAQVFDHRDGGRPPVEDPTCDLRTGDRWAPTAGLGGGQVEQVMADEERVVAILATGYAYQAASLDGPWTRLPVPIPPIGSTPTVGLAPGGELFVASDESPIFRSDDGGASFREENPRIRPGGAFVGFHRAADRLFAIYGGGFLEWVEAGWVDRTPAPFPGSGLREVWPLAEGRWIGRDVSGLLFRFDGAEWVPSDPRLVITDLTQLPSGSLIALGGASVARSRDGGRTWQRLARMNDALGVTAAPDGALLILGSPGIIARSEDEGATLDLLPVSGGTSSANRDPARRLVSRGHEVLYADGFLFGRSSDDGRTFRWGTSTVPGPVRFLGASPSGWLAETNDGRLHHHDVNGEPGWREGPLVVEGRGVTALLERASGVRWLGTRGAGVLALEPGGAVFLVGTEFPRSVIAASPDFLPVADLVEVEDSVYAAVSSAGVLRLRRSTGPWVPVNAGLPHLGTPSGVPERSVEALTYRRGVLYGGGRDALYRLDGARWARLREVDGDVLFLGRFSDGEVVAVADLDWVPDRPRAAVLREGTEVPFEAFGVGPADNRIRGVALAGDELWIWVEGAGPFRSRDRGGSWAPVSAGLPAAQAGRPREGLLAVAPRHLLVQTYEGVFALERACEAP